MELSLSNYVNLFCEGWKFMRGFNGKARLMPDIVGSDNKEAFMDGYEAGMFERGKT